MNCICQKVYDTGFTGIAKIDARLRHQYEVYGDDCIKRDYDHYNNSAQYTDAPRRPYCFVSKTQGSCEHYACDHARYRAPDTVRKMRFWIENTACKAAVHYPRFLEDTTEPEVVSYGGASYNVAGESKYGTPLFLRRTRRVTDENGEYIGTLRCLQRNEAPANDSALQEREAWEDAMFRLHKRIVERNPLRNPKGNLPAQSIESFREYVAEAMYGVTPMETGQDDVDAYLDAEAKWNARHERFWNEGYGEWSDEELQAAYS